jgi:ABC-type transporter Mla subunit MlaD
VHTAEQMTSTVQSARLATKAAAAGKATTQYLEVVLTEAETAGSAVEGTFLSVQPPTARSDDLRDQLSVLLAHASDVLAKLRIEVRRGHLGRLATIGAELDPLTKQLTEFAEANQ